MATIELDVWVDLIWPACYVAKRRLEAAVSASAQPAEVSVTYRAFRLDPDAPRGDAASAFVQLARIGGTDVDRAREAVEATAIDARPDGIVMHLDDIRPADTLDAHRTIALARAMGGLALQSAVLERLFAAQFAEGRQLDDDAVLLRLGAEAGLDERRLAAVLASDEYLEEVAADERAAAQIGITTLPFILANGHVGSTGPQTIDGISRLLGLTSERL